MSQRQRLLEQIRQQSIQKRAQALREAAQKQASNAPIAAAAGASSGGGGGGTFSYPEKVSVELPGFGSGYLCNTGDFYNDGDTPIYYGEVEISGRPSPTYMYYDGANWGLDQDLNPPYNAIGPEGAQNLYGTYTGIGPGAPNPIVSVYSGDPAAECVSPANVVSAAIQGAVAWSWQAPPNPINATQWTVVGTISGVSIVGSLDNEMFGQFILTDQGGGNWSLQTTAPGSAILNPSGSSINTVSVFNATTTGNDPSSDPSGNWVVTKFTGLITYTS